MNKFPEISYVCPMRWTELRGDESSKFCEKCGHNVTNLSEMSLKDREAILLRAKTENICVSFYQRLSGEYVTPEAPLTISERSNIKQLGIAALSVGALAIATGYGAPGDISVQVGEVSAHPKHGIVQVLGRPCVETPEEKAASLNLYIERVYEMDRKISENKFTDDKHREINIQLFKNLVTLVKYELTELGQTQRLNFILSGLKNKSLL